MGVKRNLVLGGSGTIGTALCSHLKDIGEEVINLDIKDGFDIRIENLYSHSKVDYIWFLAWDVGGAKYLTNEKHMLNIIRNNTIICQQVFSFIENTKIPFMFASSQLAAPDTPYGVTKLLGEEWARQLQGQIVSFWNVYGWEEPGEKSHVIPDLIIKGLTEKKIELITDGQEERQFIYMDDCVRNMIDIRRSGATRVDITDGHWVKIEKIANIIGEKLKVPVKLGRKKGYSVKVEPEFSHHLQFDIELSGGLDLIIEKAKAYLKNELSK